MAKYFEAIIISWYYQMRHVTWVNYDCTHKYKCYHNLEGAQTWYVCERKWNHVHCSNLTYMWGISSFSLLYIHLCVCLIISSITEGSYFSTHYYLGHRKFETGEPELFLFGETNDINFLNRKPISVSEGGGEGERERKSQTRDYKTTHL